MNVYLYYTGWCGEGANIEFPALLHFCGKTVECEVVQKFKLILNFLLSL